jgi:uncharacterized protein (DUF433 family)
MDVLDLLAAGVSDHEILEGCPDLEADDIKACRAIGTGSWNARFA